MKQRARAGVWVGALLVTATSAALSAVAAGRAGAAEAAGARGVAAAAAAAVESPSRPPRPATESPELRRYRRGEPVPACAPPAADAPRVLRESRGPGFRLDACGRLLDDRGALLERLPVATAPAALDSVVAAAGAPEPVVQQTIDGLVTSYTTTHAAAGSMSLVGPAQRFDLSDGTSWSSGSGSWVDYQARLDHVEVDGATLTFVLLPPLSTRLYQEDRFGWDGHASQGILAAEGPLELEAAAGSQTAVLHGHLRIVANEPASHAVREFEPFTAVLGSVVPFHTVITLLGGETWDAATFDRAFSYRVEAAVDFANPLSSPPVAGLEIVGPARLPDEFAAAYAARLLWDNGATRVVSTTSQWSVGPADLATVVDGVLTIGTLPGPEALLTLRASHTRDGNTYEAERVVRCLADDSPEAPGAWPMHQANARHDGYVPGTWEPHLLRRLWERDLGDRPLNQLAAAEGRVFATTSVYFDDVTSLFALDAGDGTIQWSKGFGEVFSVNPPAFAYGNVYVQTGNHGSDTWLRAFDAATGAELFQAPHAAQWERYLAPTVRDGKVYVNGGYYGGEYAFDAYSGAEDWFVSLPQVDDWTPAVDAERTWAYLGGLYGHLRTTGNIDLFVDDPAAYHTGGGQAPVLGGQDDVIVTDGGRLLRFDLVAGAIDWAVAADFSGQVSVAAGRIYAVDGGRLRVIDQTTHAELWSWQPPGGAAVVPPVIVTDSHVFLSTEDAVHAVGLASHGSEWSHPGGGHLALANGALYVATADGRVLAFAPETAPDLFTLTPCRLLDTRGFPAVYGGPAFWGGESRVLSLAGQCGIPATAGAVSINVTVVKPGGPGRVEVGWPLGSLAPAVSHSAGQTRAGSAIVGLGDDATLAVTLVQPLGSNAHVLVDVNGYFD